MLCGDRRPEDDRELVERGGRVLAYEKVMTGLDEDGVWWRSCLCVL